MVHALEEIRRLLKSGGTLIDIHPIPEGSCLEAYGSGQLLFSERKREHCSEDVLQAEQALAVSVERELFEVERRDEFDFVTYAPTARKLQEYWKDYDAFVDDPKDEAVLEREEELYTQVDQILADSGEEGQAATREKARIARLRPKK